MAATSRTCIIITCDVCQKAWEGDNGARQWNTLDEARSVATEENWFIRADGYAICPTPFGFKHANMARELLAGHHGGLSDSERGDLFAVHRWLEAEYHGDENEGSEQEDGDGPRLYTCDGVPVAWELRGDGRRRELYTTREAAEKRAETAAAKAFPDAAPHWDADSSRSWTLCLHHGADTQEPADWDIEMVYVHTEPAVDEEVVVPF